MSTPDSKLIDTQNVLMFAVTQFFDPRTQRIIIYGVVYKPVIVRKQPGEGSNGETVGIVYVRDPDQIWPVELVRVKRDVGPNEEWKTDKNVPPQYGCMVTTKPNTTPTTTTNNNTTF